LEKEEISVRVAAIYDIHGNLPALEAALEEILRAEVDQVVVGGDVVPGPMPRETIRCLQEFGIPTSFIRGNGEAAVLAEMEGADVGALPEQAREVIRWTARELQPEERQLLANWPATLRLRIRGLGEVLFCHATPRNDTEIFTRLTPEERLLPIFANAHAPLVVCGHTHMQFDRQIGSTRVMNAGSVGMPFGKPGAYWLMLGPDVQLRHTHYDLQKAAGRILGTTYPQARDFASRNVEQPPSEEEMLELFTRAQLR
jgi:predicted phosphodiesterase